jgi:hypothetical protein
MCSKSVLKLSIIKNMECRANGLSLVYQRSGDVRCVTCTLDYCLISLCAIVIVSHSGLQVMPYRAESSVQLPHSFNTLCQV